MTAAVPVLVTGGAGFIGSHVVEALASAGHRVRVLDRVPPAAHLAGEAEHVTGDLRDPGIVRLAVAGVGAVCHQAARVGLESGMSEAAGYVADNDLGTAVLLAELERAGFEGRLVLAGSMVVYGEGRYHCAQHGVVRPGPRRPEALAAGRFEPPCPACGAELSAGTITEDDALDPRNTYAATKLHQEHLSAVFGRLRGLAVTTLRYHNVYGPRMPSDTPYAGVAALFRAALARGEAPRVLEDGRQRRDFVHVADVARANLLALTADPPVDGPLNVASGEPRTVGEMAAALSDSFGPAAPRPSVTGGWRLGDVRHVVASPERAAERLGFRAAVGFAEGMAGLAADGPAG